MTDKPVSAREQRRLNHQDGEHIMLRLTYISRYNPNNAPIELARILEQAQKNNERRAITGVLVINENYFLQSIEGSRPAINELLRALSRDKRHFSLQVIECCEINQRRFSKWSMKYLTVKEEDLDYIFKLSTTTRFDPYLMNKAQVLQFIDTLSHIQEQQEREFAK